MILTKERPILFTGQEVRATQEGRKTQTRRVVREDCQGYTQIFLDGAGVLRQGGMQEQAWTKGGRAVRCPYGQPGDRLWVKETWAHYQTVNRIRKTDGRSFSEVSDGLAGYRADGYDTIEDFRKHVQMMSGCDLEAVEIRGDRWRPSIFMPRWASRLTLEVTGVRVERLQEISEREARAEGYESARAFMAGDWASKKAESNPWVWVLDFKRVEG